jgi:hypothetical protein
LLFECLDGMARDKLKHGAHNPQPKDEETGGGKERSVLRKSFKYHARLPCKRTRMAGDL